MGYTLNKTVTHYAFYEGVNEDGDPAYIEGDPVDIPAHAYYITGGKDYREDGHVYAVDWDAVALIPADVENLTSDSRFELPGVKGRFKIDGGVQDLNTGAASWQPGLIELRLTRIG